jgi:hypothetical protein
MMEKIKEIINTVGVDSPPLNITPEGPKHGLKYAAVEVPAGVRGRMSLIGLIREKDIPILEIQYPHTEEEGQDFVYKIAEFLKSLPSGSDEK